MTTFVTASLVLFAVFAVLGMAAPFLLAARHRKPHLAILALAAAAWVIVVCVAAAVTMP